jgi:hypothetical protein
VPGLSSSKRRRRAGWWAAGLTVVSALLGFVVLFRPIGGPVNPANPPPPPRVSITPIDGRSGNLLLHDQATIFDPTPLFLPTEWNTNQGPLPAVVQRQPGQVFPDFDPKLTFGQAELVLPIESAESTPQQPVDLLKVQSRDPFLGFGRVDVALAPLASRSAVVEVREVGTGKVVLTRMLDIQTSIPSGEPDWKPAEFLISVTAEGLLGRPMETASSDLEDVDVFFRDYLATTLRLGERLAPGMYYVVVGP